MDKEFWNDRYRGREQLFSGSPNGVLVAEVTDLPPGRALDVGCGEGADALWLARRGWQVTAVDISRVALQRAAAAGADVANRVTWTCTDLLTTPPSASAFDLVSVHYFPLPRQPEHAALRVLLNAVASGGTLLFASHDLAELSPRPEQDVKAGDYYQPDDIVKLLDDGWRVLINEFRPRANPAPAGTHHTRDAVLRVQCLQ
ncbi:MAG: class I SAM-dependent methyltransferase [Pseudomonadota bacterium]|nr:class I SAM-dependent methyltransferase [Pseudomonadota bacterium]